MAKKEKKEKKIKEPKTKTPMNPEQAKQIVNAVTAVVCVLAVGIASSSVTGKLCDAKVEAAKAFAQSSPTVSDNNEYTDSEGSTDTDIPTYDDTQDTDAPDATDTEETAETQENASAAEETTTAKKDTNGAPQTNAEIIEYCNKALNDAKAAKVGYTKTFVREGGDNLPKIVSSIIKQNKTTTAEKGDDNIINDFPAAGYSWSSKLRESDVSKVEFKQNGQFYEIKLYLPNETNPGKGEASKYGRVMSVITEEDAKSMLSAVKSAEFTYHDGYVYAKIDSKTGKLVKAEFSASADLVGELSVIGTIKAQNIKSTETFTDIKW